MTDILVLANETIGGKNLLDAVLRRRDETGGDLRFHVVVPKTRPRHGNNICIQSESVFSWHEFPAKKSYTAGTPQVPSSCSRSRIFLARTLLS